MVFEIGRKTKTEVKKAIVAEGSVVAVPKEAVNPDVVKMPNGIYRLSDRGVKNALAQFKVKKEPYYKEQKRADGTPLNEKKFFEACFKSKIPLLLKGPTGCGKTRFIEHMAFNLGIPLVSVGCNEDTTAPGLVGMLLPVGDQIWWKDGPLALTARGGGICYLDEIVEARKDTIVAIHSLTDYRRVLYLDRTGEVIEAPDDFMLIAAYNPNYQSFAKSLKPSTKQRFVAIEFGWPSVDDETEIIMKETGVDRATAKRLAELAANLRESKAETPAMEEVASTRTLVYAARLIAEEGVKPKEAALNAIANIIKADGITDDEKTGIDDIIEGSFK